MTDDETSSNEVQVDEVPVDEVQVADNPGRHRYEVRVGSDVAGFAVYESQPGRVVVVHTEIDPSFEGRGLGGRLAKDLLDDLRRRGLAVTPVCPFIAGYIKHHQAYADLVYAPHRNLAEP